MKLAFLFLIRRLILRVGLHNAKKRLWADREAWYRLFDDRSFVGSLHHGPIYPPADDVDLELLAAWHNCGSRWGDVEQLVDGWIMDTHYARKRRLARKQLTQHVIEVR